MQQSSPSPERHNTDTHIMHRRHDIYISGQVVSFASALGESRQYTINIRPVPVTSTSNKQEGGREGGRREGGEGGREEGGRGGGREGGRRGDS